MAVDHRNTLVPSAEAARFLGVQRQTLRKWRLTGRGPPYIRLGGTFGRVAYRPADLEQWVVARRFASTAAEAAVRAPSREPPDS